MTSANRGQIMVLDPSGYLETEASGLAPRIGDLHGKTVGLLDDGLAHAGALLDRVGELLQERYGVAEVIKKQKPNLSLPSPAALLAEMKANVDFMVVGVGG